MMMTTMTAMLLVMTMVMVLLMGMTTRMMCNDDDDDDDENVHRAQARAPFLAARSLQRCLQKFAAASKTWKYAPGARENTQFGEA